MAYIETRNELLEANPALKGEWSKPNRPNSLKWCGAFAMILKTSTPVAVRKMAASMHNRQQHNTHGSNLLDLVRTFQMMARENHEAVC
jgi:hypothetical protein